MRRCFNAPTTKCLYVSAHILYVCARHIQISGCVNIGTTHKRVCAQWKFHERADYVMGLKKYYSSYLFLLSTSYPMSLKKTNESLNGTVSF